MVVADVMTTEVVAVEPETSLAEAAAWMVRHRVSGLPVLDDSGKLIGILTEGDLLHRPELGTCGRPAGWMRGIMRAETLAAEYAHTHGRQVGDVMTHNPTYVHPDLKLAKAAELMRQKQVKRLPVLDDDRLVGMLSRFDILLALAARLEDSSVEMSDDEILDDIQAALAQEPWAPRAGVDFIVCRGRVRIVGRVGSVNEARAVNILVRNTRGVMEVEDGLEIARAGCAVRE